MLLKLLSHLIKGGWGIHKKVCCVLSLGTGSMNFHGHQDINNGERKGNSCCKAFHLYFTLALIAIALIYYFILLYNPL